MNIGDILLVGARGRMGRLLAERARATGLAVRGLDAPLSPEALAQGARGADLVLLAVPAAAMAEVAGLCAAAMAPGQILADICSVKVQPLAEMLAAHPGPVVGTHPLFGPTPGPDATRVAIVPGRGEAAAGAVADLMARLGFTPFATTAEAHDEAMAHVQGLNFVTSVAYLATLAQRPDLADFATPSFTRRLEAARKMLTEDSALFAGLMDANPYTQDAVRTYRSMLNIAAGGDIELLCERANWWWRHDTGGGG